MRESMYIINTFGDDYLISWYSRDVYSDDSFRRFLKTVVKKEGLLEEINEMLKLCPGAYEYNSHRKQLVAQ